MLESSYIHLIVWVCGCSSKQVKSVHVSIYITSIIYLRFVYLHNCLISSLFGDCTAISNGIPSLGGDNLLHLKDGDNSMEQILEKIVIVQSQVHQLNTRIEKLITENPGKFSSVNRLSMVISGSAGNIPDEEPPSPAANGQFSSVKSLYATSQLVSDGDAADLLLPNQPITEHLGTSALPDVVESTKKVNFFC